MEPSIEQFLPFPHNWHAPSQTEPSINRSLVENRRLGGKKGVTVALLSLALACVSLTPDTALAATITAANCSRSAVGTAVNSAANGDTVLIPAGSCTWTTNLTIAGKYLTLQGAGAGKTIITDGVSKGVYPNIPQVLVWNTITGGLSRLSGITFQGGTIPDPYNKGVVQFEGASQTFRIDHCKFIPTQTAGLYIRGEMFGVIDHNVFDLSARKGFAIYIMGGSYGDIAWSEASTLGTVKNVFVEDNVITQDQSLSFYYYGVDGWNGSRVVYRHNQFNNTTLGNHGTESGGRMRSQRSYEIYNNTFTWNMQGNALPSTIGTRGGTGVIYNNTATVTNGILNYFIDYEYYRAVKNYPPWGQCPSVWDAAADRCLDQTGVGQGIRLSGDTPSPTGWPNQVSDPAYDWNNLLNGAISNAYSKRPTVLRENRDFFHTPKPGYAPYTYPHPLVTSSGSTSAPPAPPQNVTIR